MQLIKRFILFYLVLVVISIIFNFIYYKSFLFKIEDSFIYTFISSIIMFLLFELYQKNK